MKVYACRLLVLLVTITWANAQVEFVKDDFFPADLEFPELKSVPPDESFEDPERLAEIENGRYVRDVGFEKYARRVCTTSSSGSLVIEVVTLRDNRAAFSLLTLLRDHPLQDGPPGDQFVAEADRIQFAAGKRWVRITGRRASQDLLKRVALSVSNRIGSSRRPPPSLVSYFPRSGYDAASLRYFVGPRCFKAFSIAASDGFVRFSSDMELAQARYEFQNQTGVLSISVFPTPQVAEGYFSDLPSLVSRAPDNIRSYAKRAGPLVAILEGSFNPTVAERILGPIEYSYSIRWLYEKPKVKTVWGIPLVILGTVVNSLLLVAFLCLISMVAGLVYGVFRFGLRTHALENPLDRPERTEISRLKLR